MRKLLKFLFWFALVAGIVVGLLRATAMRWWQLPNDDPLAAASVEPTLRGGDWVLLWRATEPSFGDLVICPNPEDPSVTVVGRIVGESGDKIAIDDHRIFINDRPVRTERACNENKVYTLHPTTGNEIELNCDWEELGGETHMRATIPSESKWGRPKHIRTTVPDGFVYLISDNRLHHYDSRNFGAVERSTCRESIFFRLVSAEGFYDHGSRLTYIH